MREKLGWICCILLLAGCAFFILSRNTQADTKDTWEYAAYGIYDTRAFDAQQLNKMGSQGWEMVTVMPADKNNFVRFLFKRKK